MGVVVCESGFAALLCSALASTGSGWGPVHVAWRDSAVSAYACCSSSLRLSDSSFIQSASSASTFMAFFASELSRSRLGFRKEDDLAGVFMAEVIAVPADQDKSVESV